MNTYINIGMMLIICSSIHMCEMKYIGSWCWCLWGFYVRLPCSCIADKYFFFLLGLRLLHISCVGVGGLSPISISGVCSGKRSMSAGSSGSSFVGFGSEPVYVHLVRVDRSLFSWASLLCWSVCVVSSVEGLMSAVCVWTQVVFSPTASLFAFYWSIRWVFLLLLDCERCFFFWACFSGVLSRYYLYSQWRKSSQNILLICRVFPPRLLWIFDLFWYWADFLKICYLFIFS